ncbi:hypothetical protein D9V41_10590 [Aeromicrobium phragmitis]|uniref:DUF2550 family protein n=1 Tax=Aeromicrobium phragmitis TaxID=2478914 RepID=A0A3L8PJX6_9ACTN|nr:hypothetical protein [Aeromicrobium phragmitis]RLV55530.1 hypothetical protein D9V41_10590 [Aeromicrobium phragmitis]
MLDIVLIVLAVLGALVVLALLVGAARVLRMRRRLRSRLGAAGTRESDPATLFGWAADRRDQRPGPGMLGLGPDTLVFVQLMPEREVRIERSAITSVTADRHFMGRTSNRELLVVTWDDNGMGDAAAFVVNDLPAWRERLS